MILNLPSKVSIKFLLDFIDLTLRIEENLIWMKFDAKQDFKEKNVTITVKDVKDVYDTDGNMMHDNKATFYIKGFIKYPETT